MIIPRQILDRLGQGNAARRLAREHELHEKRLARENGGFSLRRFFTVNAVIGFVIRLSGLRKRGLRNALDLRIVEHEVFLPGLPTAFEGFRLLQLADLHCDLHPKIMEGVLTVMAQIPHDAVVLTGDYLNEILHPIEESLEAMRQFIPHLHPVRFAILGNHDYLEMVPRFEQWGLPVLLNESRAIERTVVRNGECKKERLWICGVDDAHAFHSHDLKAARAGIPGGEITILLSHTPETHREAAALGYHLHLNGHTHGGQICWPGGTPIYHNAPGCRGKLLAGSWREGSMLGYTSRGTGSAGVAARFFCPPEVTVHILRSDRN
jgi:predicted MPP superfamily phosphohydrolase